MASQGHSRNFVLSDPSNCGGDASGEIERKRKFPSLPYFLPRTRRVSHADGDSFGDGGGGGVETLGDDELRPREEKRIRGCAENFPAFGVEARPQARQMAAFAAGKTKRNDWGDVCDDFSEFSLSSPARKIRRLDAELPPIMEEEDLASPMGVEQPPAANADVVIEDSPVAGAANVERALVLYRPVDAQLLLGPGQLSASFQVSSDFIHGLKSQVFLGRKTHYSPEERLEGGDHCLAVVPWAAARSNMTGHFAGEPQKSPEEEPMEAEDPEPASMELEEDSGRSYTGGAIGSGGFDHWQNQCTVPQLPPPPPPRPACPLMW